MLAALAAVLLVGGARASPLLPSARSATSTAPVGTAVLGTREGGVPPKPEIVSMDPYTLETKVLYKDTAADLLNTGSMGAVDARRQLYYTLMQPDGSQGIHLAKFDFSGPATTKDIIPLKVTVALGHCDADGFVVGIDEDGPGGPYFVRLDPTTGVAVQQVYLGKNFSMDSVAVAIDKEASVLYVVLGHLHGGNEFTLWAIDTRTGAFRNTPTVLGPTPDLTGPAGMMLYRPHAAPDKAVLLAFLPMPPSTRDANTSNTASAPSNGVGGSSAHPKGLAGSRTPKGSRGSRGVASRRVVSSGYSGWQLVAIDPGSGQVSPTQGMYGNPSQRVIDDGASYLVPKQSGAADGSVLYAAFAADIGLESTMFGIDVECALGQAVKNCTVSSSPWPPSRLAHPLANLGVYTPPAAGHA